MKSSAACASVSSDLESMGDWLDCCCVFESVTRRTDTTAANRNSTFSKPSFVQRAFLLRTELSVLFVDTLLAEKHPIREQGALSADTVSAADRE